MSVRERSRPPAALRGADRELWLRRHGTAWERCLADILSSARWGVSAQGHFRANPPLHIVKEARWLSSGWAIWCGGGLAHEGVNNITSRRCPRCMALAREQADESYDDYQE